MHGRVTKPPDNSLRLQHDASRKDRCCPSPRSENFLTGFDLGTRIPYALPTFIQRNGGCLRRSAQMKGIAGGSTQRVGFIQGFTRGKAWRLQISA
jgi:hypothetical protein